MAIRDSGVANNASAKPKRKPRPRKPPAAAPPPRSEAVGGSGYRIPKGTPVAARSPVFTAPLGRGPALHQQRKQAREKVREAEEALPGPTVRLPRFPKLDRYTPAQRRAIIMRTSRVIRQAAARGQLDSYLATKPGEEMLTSRLEYLADRETRTAMHKLAGALQTRQRTADIALGRKATQGKLLQQAPTLANLAEIGRRVREGQLDLDVAGASRADRLDPANRKTMLGGFLDDRVFNYAPNLRVLTAPTELTRAFFEDPVQTTKTSVRTGIESIAGIPQGIKALVEDPKEGLKAIGEDYSQRYGPLLEGNTAKFRKQVQEESGVTPFVLDAAAVGAPVGRGFGAVARAGATARTAERLASVNEPILSRVLGAANRTATMERPALRSSGGEGGVRRQETSRNLFVAMGQRGLDTARRKTFERRARRQGLRPTPDGRLERIPGEATSGRVQGLRPGANEVLPFFSPREMATRKFTGRVARDIGATKGQARLRLLQRRSDALRDMERQMKNLTPEERSALFPVVKYGLPAITDAKSRAQAVAAIERRLAQIKRERKSSGFKGTPAVIRETNDEVALLRKIRDDPEAFLTPNLREAADELIAVQRREEQLDPDLNADRAQIRRDTPQGALLGVKRGPDEDYMRGALEEVELLQQARGRDVAPGQLRESHGGLAALLPERRPEAAKRLEDKAQSRLDAAQRTLAKAREDLAKATGRAEVLSRNVTGTRKGENRAEAGGGLGVAQARQRVEEAEAAVKQARDAHAAARAVTAAVKKKDTMRLESAADFDARVRQAAEEAGLSEPGYWLSSPRPQETYSNAAVGTGGRAAAKSKRYTGALAGVGIETHTPDVFITGVERNIKRRFSWALVSRNMEVHAFEWSRGRQGEGLSAQQILRELDERHIDAGSVAFINARVVRRRDPDEDGVDRGTVVDSGPVAEDQVLAQVNQELHESRRSLRDLQNEETQGQAANRYLVVPREVADELEGATRPDGPFARAAEIILKQKPARILLGTFNVPWLSFQVASNAFLTGLGGGRNPLDIYGAHKWWRGLSDEQKDAIEIELGITRGRHFAMDETHLGSQKDKFGPASHLVNFWQGYKTSRVGRFVHKGNVLDLMFRADEAQNNFFRKVLFYNQAKKTAYREMGANWRTMDGVQKKLMATLSLPPERMGGQIVKKGPQFEKHAKAVNDFLGNYLTFSNMERRLLSRNIMFYGYLRFSLRFAFWTMPVEHPVMTAMLTNLGRMGADEIKELFGVPDTYQLPTNMLGRVYSGATPEEIQAYVTSDGRRGKLPSSVNVGRMNPGLNALTQMEGAQQAIGLVSPLYQSIVDQLFEESTFTGRDYRINGQTTPAESQRAKNYYGSMWSMFIPGRPRNRILMADLLGLVYPYRLATKTGIPQLGVEPLEGPQSDDSLLFSRRPMKYKDEDIQKSIQRSIERERENGTRGLLPQLLPVTPMEDIGPVVIQRELEKEADAADRTLDDKKPKKSKKKAGSYQFRSGTGGSSGYQFQSGGG